MHRNLQFERAVEEEIFVEQVGVPVLERIWEVREVVGYHKNCVDNAKDKGCTWNSNG